MDTEKSKRIVLSLIAAALCVAGAVLWIAHNDLLARGECRKQAHAGAHAGAHAETHYEDAESFKRYIDPSEADGEAAAKGKVLECENVNDSWLNDLFDGGVYVITMESRKEHITKTMKEMKVKAEIFDAIDSKILDRAELISMGKITPFCNLNTPRIACHLSHHAVLNKFLSTTAQSCFIFEDDVGVPRDLVDTSKKMQYIMANIPPDWDVINFGRCWDNCAEAKLINKHTIKSNPVCRHAYAVSRKGAAIIVEKTLPMSFNPGDQMIQNLGKESQLDIFVSSPALFHQRRHVFGTFLGNTKTLREAADRCADFIRVSVVVINSDSFEGLEQRLIKPLGSTDVVDEIIVGVKPNTKIDLSAICNDSANPALCTSILSKIQEAELTGVAGSSGVDGGALPILDLDLALQSRNDTILVVTKNAPLTEKDAEPYLRKLLTIYQSDRLNIYGQAAKGVGAQVDGKKAEVDCSIFMTSRAVLERIQRDIEKNGGKITKDSTQGEINKLINDSFFGIFDARPTVVVIAHPHELPHLAFSTKPAQVAAMAPPPVHFLTSLPISKPQ
jgi:GR25 family glycosyltransferase involved in LPS biosynthesis